MSHTPSTTVRNGAGFVFGIAALVASVTPAGALGSAVDAEVARLGSLYASATQGSAAQFRLHEELDALQAADTVSSPADFRLAEQDAR